MIVSRGILAAFLATALWAGPALAGADDVEENNSLVAPEVQDIDDLFRRGIDRVADQATGGIDLPSASGEIGRQTRPAPIFSANRPRKPCSRTGTALSASPWQARKCARRSSPPPIRTSSPATSRVLPMCGSGCSRMNQRRVSSPSISRTTPSIFSARISSCATKVKPVSRWISARFAT